MKYSKDSIGLWKTEYNSLKSHGGGLTQRDINFLQNLKEGDVLIVFKNEDAEGSKPQYSLKSMEGKPKKDDF